MVPRTDSYVAGIGLQVPIYSGGSTSARVRGLYQDQIAAEQQLESVQRRVVKEITSAYLTADTSAEKISASRNALAWHSCPEPLQRKRSATGWSMPSMLTSVRNEYRAHRICSRPSTTSLPMSLRLIAGREKPLGIVSQALTSG